MLATSPAPMSAPPGSVLISAYTERGFAYEAKGDYANARLDYTAALQGIASGELITSKTSLPVPTERRIVMSRCYGNSQPRRNAHDNSTDMCSFPFIRHHFQRSGFEVIEDRKSVV